ncbi:MAG: selenide, water dikinase SelD [Proteobacteria bacterium]|nr:selenide, water dikinase SelD [Pseudomonadota bacterium]
MQSVPVIKDLVLLGGGHSHIAVLKSFGMRPIPGVRLTLISRDIETAYSGMLPGLIAGHYSFDRAHIDLVPLARFAGARFFHDEVTGIDPVARTVALLNRPPVSYDVLSVNTGSTPSIHEVDGAGDHAVPVKPINRFLGHWENLRQRIDEYDAGARIGVVGGGTGGVELCLAVHHALTTQPNPPEGFSLELLTADGEILQEHPRSVARRFRRILYERGIEVHVDTRVTRVTPNTLVDAAGREFRFHEILWVTQAGAPPWLAGSGIEVDERGFMLVNDHLQSQSHANVFGAGDVVAMATTPRPKAGVFAVRQGRPLTKNLRRYLLKKPLTRYRPQRRFLKLVSSGDRYAVASRGPWSAEGRWVWRWKDWIDSRFMEKYQVLPEMAPMDKGPEIPAPLQDPAIIDAADDDMRCGGCGAKVSADVLAAALAEIDSAPRDDVVVGLEAPDDAAMIAVPADRLSVLSVDGFRPMIDDPWLFGRITANHCLGDVYAMGAEPQVAMTMATLPVWPEDKLVDELRQMLLGALHVFDQEGVALVGGHTGEGAELTLGFTVTGLIEPDRALRKSALRAGDLLVLTKPLGTGTLLAADMRGRVHGRWLKAAIESMLLSCRTAGTVFRAHEAHACTDITGFGLAGHLLEMLGETTLGALIELDALPVLPGALETVEAGILSTLQPKNERFAAQVDASAEDRDRGEYGLLFDPQTAGGLLAGVPRDTVQSCVTELKARGYPETVVIGEIEDAGDWRRRIRLRTAS